MKIDGFEERKKSFSFIFKAFNLSTVDLVALSWLKITGQVKGLKIKQSYFFFFKTIYVLESMSHVSLLPDQFCIHMLKLRFLIERKPNYRRDPLPPRSGLY